ncbi:MAG TPA: hypothetical protein GXZ78_07570 [Eubacteriaceae bacterium]|nr:hypothetical protein [Eubacteriaceae bacterium]
MVSIKGLLRKIQDGNINKNIQNLIIIGLIGIAIVMAGTFFFEGGQRKPTSSNNLPTELSQIIDYETKLKKELEETLASIEGVGRVEVMLTVANEKEVEIAYSKTQSQNLTQEKDNQGGERIIDQNNLTETAVMVNENGVNSPFIIRENRPEIKGVVVVAEGAHDATIKYQLNKAVQIALDLPSHKVVIYGRKN